MDIYETLEYPLPILSLNPSEISIETSGKYEGSFHVANVGGSHLSGIISVKPEGFLTVSDKEFESNNTQIRFSADLSNFKRGDIINTQIIVSSNGGEMSIPVKMKVMPFVLDVSKDCRITSLQELYDYRKINEPAVIKLFYSSIFRRWLKDLKYKYLDVYDTIVKDKNEDRALKNFFILNKFDDVSMILPLEQNAINDIISRNMPTFSLTLSRDEFVSNEKGYLLIANNGMVDTLLNMSSEMEYIKFNRQDVKVKAGSRVKIHFTAKLTAIQIAQLGIKRIPFFKDKICVSIVPYTGSEANNLVTECFDVTIGEVRFKGHENQIASGLKALLDYRITGNIDCLKKAMMLAGRFVNDRQLSVPALLYSALICVEADDIETAKSILNSVAKHRTYYKANSPEVYGIIMFLFALCDLKKGRLSERSREVKVLDECEKEHGHFMFPLALGVLSFEKGDIVQAGMYFAKCYERGCRSSYFAGYLYSFFQREAGPGTSQVLNWFINWALAKGIDIRMNIVRNRKNLTDSLFFESGTLHKLYDEYEIGFLLEEICKAYIAKNDFGENEYVYYKKAEQIQVEGICFAIVKTAKNLNDENISRYVITKFLHEGAGSSDLTAFVYHLIIMDAFAAKKYGSLLFAYSSKIVEFGKRAITLGKKGRCYNSVYKFMIDSAKNDIMIKAHEGALDAVLFEDLFSYSLLFKSNAATHVWISEKECSEAIVHSVKDGQAYIKAMSDDFDLVCYDIRQALITTEKPQLHRMVELADTSLYLRLYRRDYCSDELLISLAKYILEFGSDFNDNKGGKSAANMRTVTMSIPSDEALDILNQSANIANISDGLRMCLRAAAANIMCEQGNYEKAFEEYIAIDEKYINKNHIERMLDALIEKRLYDKLCRIINKKAQSISSASMLKAIIQIAENSMYASYVANEAYNILISLRFKQYPSSVIDIVAKYYKGSMGEYESLFDSLSEKGLTSKEIAEIVIENSIYCNRASPTAQKAFVSFYKIVSKNHILTDFENKLIEQFTYCCIYEIIVRGCGYDTQAPIFSNSTKIRFDVIDVLEKIYEKGVVHNDSSRKDRLLAYALCTFYCENGMRTFKASGIIKDATVFMEQDGFVLPAMKKCSIEEVITPYVQKKQTFSYRSQPGASVFFYYKLAGDDKFNVKPMKYLRFGIYLASVNMFHGDEITYFVSEEMRSGSIATKEEIFVNNAEHCLRSSNKFSDINNCLIYMQKSRFDKAEAIIEEYLKPPKTVVGKML